MSPSDPLYILAVDHRTSFSKGLFGFEREPDDFERATMAEAKRIVADALIAARETVHADGVVLLTDEQYGAAAADRAAAHGVRLAICAERSSVPEFDFEYGDAFGEHIELFGPELVKVLVRWDPDGDPALNRRQAIRLAELSAWLSDRAPRFLLELLVPTPDADDASQAKARLMVRAIETLQEHAVEPDIWKVEGLDTSEACAAVAATARRGGREEVGLVVLGAGAPWDTVRRWFRAAAEVDGYLGFAIGRTIWWDALSAWIAGTRDRDEAVAAIAASYAQAVEAYAELAAV